MSLAFSAHAQEPVLKVATPSPQANTGAMVEGGIIGGIAGLFAGIAAGNVVDRARGLDPKTCRTCTRWGAATGAGLGMTTGIALGVHAFNNGRGRAGSVLLRTSATVGVFWAASYAAHRLAPEGVDALMVLAGLGGGIYSAVRAERSTMTLTVR